MASLFSRIKGSSSPSGVLGTSGSSKKDANTPQPTPLEKHLADYNGPIRMDGSDKFFGFENFGSTCYANSIIQCLYYNTPFREQVIGFPSRTPYDVLNRTAIARSPTTTTPAQSPVRKTAAATQNTTSGKTDNKDDNNDLKKKLALQAGPILQMDYENSPTYGMDGSLFTSLKDIFEGIIANRSRIGIVSPTKFLEILRNQNEMFRSAMHQDAHEFLNLLLNEVIENVEAHSKSDGGSLNHDGKAVSGTEEAKGLKVAPSVTARPVSSSAGTLTSVSNTGWVHDLFEGTLTSETRCLTCENISQRDEAFLDLSLDLDEHTSVTSCLRKFSAEEMLCERNKFHCDNCGGLQEAEKRMKIKRLPRILALHLKRFKYTEDFGRLQKLFHRVQYPYQIRLFNTTDDATDPDRLYELYAVVVHIGAGPYHGHYVAIIKTEDRGWLLFDDELVEPVEPSYVSNFFGGEGTMACAYVLFYQETTLEKVRMEQEFQAQKHKPQQAAAATEPANSIPLKANGFTPLNSHLHSPISPPVNGDEHFTSLTHAATVSTSSPTAVQPPPAANALTPALTTGPLPPSTTGKPTSPALPSHPLSPVSPTIKSPSKSAEKAEKAADKAKEKQRKLAEKEAEKLAKQRQKEMTKKRIEHYKKQEEDVKKALAASKASAKEEDKRRKVDVPAPEPSPQPVNPATVQSPVKLVEKPATSPAFLATDPATMTTTVSGSAPAPPANGPPSNGSSMPGGAFMANSMSRFRHGSMSLRSKGSLFKKRDTGSGSSAKDTDDSAIADDPRPPPVPPKDYPSDPGFSAVRSPPPPTPPIVASPEPIGLTALPDVKSQVPPSLSHIVSPQSAHVLNSPPAVPLQPPPIPQSSSSNDTSKTDKQEKRSSRFGLGRKRSAFLSPGGPNS